MESKPSHSERLRLKSHWSTAFIFTLWMLSPALLSTVLNALRSSNANQLHFISVHLNLPTYFWLAILHSQLTTIVIATWKRKDRVLLNATLLAIVFANAIAGWQQVFSRAICPQEISSLLAFLQIVLAIPLLTGVGIVCMSEYNSVIKRPALTGVILQIRLIDLLALLCVLPVFLSIVVKYIMSVYMVGDNISISEKYGIRFWSIAMAIAPSFAMGRFFATEVQSAKILHGAMIGILLVGFGSSETTSLAFDFIFVVSVESICHFISMKRMSRFLR